MKTSKTQLEASKKYLSKKKRIYVAFDPDQVKEIENLIKYYGYYLSIPEFIRDACSFYAEAIREGKIEL